MLKAPPGAKSTVARPSAPTVNVSGSVPPPLLYGNVRPSDGIANDADAFPHVPTRHASIVTAGVLGVDDVTGGLDGGCAGGTDGGSLRADEHPPATRTIAINSPVERLPITRQV